MNDDAAGKPNLPGDSLHPKETSRVGFNLTLVAIVLGSLMQSIAAGNPSAVVVCLPFTFGPLGISLLIAWFLFVLFTVYFSTPDANAPLAFLFVGIYSLPVMIIFWIVALTKEPRFWQQT